MSSEAREQILRMIEGRHLRPSAVEFEMAYQARVAIDRIRFAIKATEQSIRQPELLFEVGIQLLDALGRLEGAERSFQHRCGSFSKEGACNRAEPRPNGFGEEADRRNRSSNA